MATTMICGAAVAVFGAGQASAQTDRPGRPDRGRGNRRHRFAVPPHRHRDPLAGHRADLENLQRAGMTTATDAIRSVSADGAGSIGTGFQSGFSAGGSAVSLRGLGVSSTLVLVDGLRSANFPINDDGHNAYVDLNSIPFSLIDRIEVLKDGASSSYGADAIGGVVNLILKKQFEGVSGSAEFGQSQERDARHQRFDLTLGYGDYAEKGWNFYVNGEYQKDGRVSNHSRGFPYNTQDLRSIGGLDNNTADSTLTTATPTAVVVRTTQGDLNNPLSGGVRLFPTDLCRLEGGHPALQQLYLAGPGHLPGGTYTVTSGGARGTGCKYDLVDLYNQIQPKQERYALNGRLSFKLNENVEGYVTGSYSYDFVSIKNQPRALRNTQPFGGSASLASTNPGIVLPVWICTSGVNCADPAAAGRRLNPNNPYAAAFANDPANGAARIYYLFGDIPAGSDRTNEVIRGTAGLKGDFGGDWNWRVDGVGARDNLKIEQYGFLNIANLLKSINTGSYDFVNPGNNTQAVRDFVSPTVTTPSHSTMYSLDASITKTLWALPGGDHATGRRRPGPQGRTGQQQPERQAGHLLADHLVGVRQAHRHGRLFRTRWRRSSTSSRSTPRAATTTIRKASATSPRRSAPSTRRSASWRSAAPIRKASAPRPSRNRARAANMPASRPTPRRRPSRTPTAADGAGPATPTPTPRPIRWAAAMSATRT
jgi:iron complex outermembrane receptor protein